MRVRLIDEYNADGHLLWAEEYPGAYARGRTRDEALAKLPDELGRYARWLGLPAFGTDIRPEIAGETLSALRVCDADSDVLFDSELPPLTRAEYERLRGLALRSARDFLALYESVPDKDGTTLPPRETFYGAVPRTAREMYRHTNGVNDYYFGEIGVAAVNGPDILACRAEAFAALERAPGFLQNAVFDGSWGERWTLRKVCRRFVWHDRIHARAMYRMAAALCGEDALADPFGFGSR